MLDLAFSAVSTPELSRQMSLTGGCETQGSRRGRDVYVPTFKNIDPSVVNCSDDVGEVSRLSYSASRSKIYPKPIMQPMPGPDAFYLGDRALKGYLLYYKGKPEKGTLIERTTHITLNSKP